MGIGIAGPAEWPRLRRMQYVDPAVARVAAQISIGWGCVAAVLLTLLRALQAVLQSFDLGAQGLDLFDQAADQCESFYVQQHGGIGVDTVPAQFYQPVFLGLADALKLPL